MDPYTSIWCEAVENSIDAEHNTSNVTVTLKCNSSSFADDGPVYWLKVNDTIVKSGLYNFSAGTFTIVTHTMDVAHDEEGYGSMTYQGYFQGTQKPNPGNTTQVYVLNLTPIAPEPEPEPTVTSPAGLVSPFDIDFNRTINFLVPEPDILYFSL